MGGKVDLMPDIAGIGDPVECEVVVVTGGGVKVDVTDSQGTLDHALLVVDVLHPFQSGFLNVTTDDPALDVQTAAGDRVSRGHPLDEPDDYGQGKKHHDKYEDFKATSSDQLGDDRDDHGRDQPLQVEGKDGTPGRMPLIDDSFSSTQGYAHRREHM